MWKQASWYRQRCAEQGLSFSGPRCSVGNGIGQPGRDRRTVSRICPPLSCRPPRQPAGARNAIGRASRVFGAYLQQIESRLAMVTWLANGALLVVVWLCLRSRRAVGHFLCWPFAALWRVSGGLCAGSATCTTRCAALDATQERQDEPLLSRRAFAFSARPLHASWRFPRRPEPRHPLIRSPRGGTSRWKGDVAVLAQLQSARIADNAPATVVVAVANAAPRAGPVIDVRHVPSAMTPRLECSLPGTGGKEE